MLHSIVELPAKRRRYSHGGSRPGAGRPKLFADKFRFLLDLERDDYERLSDIADEKGLSVGAVVRSAISTYLKRHRRR